MPLTIRKVTIYRMQDKMVTAKGLQLRNNDTSYPSTKFENSKLVSPIFCMFSRPTHRPVHNLKTSWNVCARFWLEFLLVSLKSPIFSNFIHRLLNKIMSSKTLIIIGETGCGKTTQIPQIIYESKPDFGAIAITQPRRVACITISKRVALEQKCTIGDIVGYLELTFQSQRWKINLEFRPLSTGTRCASTTSLHPKRKSSTWQTVRYCVKRWPINIYGNIALSYWTRRTSVRLTRTFYSE